MRAILYSPDGAFSVGVRDVSLVGARVLAQDPLPDSCDAIFKLGSVFVAARLVWTDGNEGGLRFYRDLSESELSGWHTAEHDRR